MEGNQRIARSCYEIAAREVIQITSLDARGNLKKERQKPQKDVKEVEVRRDNTEKIVKIITSLEEGLRKNLVGCLEHI